RTYGTQVTDCDLAVIAAARHARRARVLLGAVHPVGEGVIRDHVVELRRGLVVPTAPGTAIVERDHGALVAAHDHAGGARGVDPQLMVIVPAGLPLEHAERLTAVGGLE